MHKNKRAVIALDDSSLESVSWFKMNILVFYADGILIHQGRDLDHWDWILSERSTYR